MNNFAAIDFETANYHRTSVCSVGIVIVHHGEVVDKFHSLIRPEPNWYVPFFTQDIHGISFADTIGERLFPEVWAEVVPKIETLPLVAHNKSFDEGCLRAVFELYGMTYPGYEFYCTLCGAHQAVKNLPDYGLETVAAYCGYDLQNHHNALADAEACAAIAMKIL